MRRTLSILPMFQRTGLAEGFGLTGAGGFGQVTYESELAACTGTSGEPRRWKQTYNPYQATELDEKFPGFPFSHWLLALGADRRPWVRLLWLSRPFEGCGEVVHLHPADELEAVGCVDVLAFACAVHVRRAGSGSFNFYGKTPFRHSAEFVTLEARRGRCREGSG